MRIYVCTGASLIGRCTSAHIYMCVYMCVYIRADLIGVASRGVNFRRLIATVLALILMYKVFFDLSIDIVDSSDRGGVLEHEFALY